MFSFGKRSVIITLIVFLIIASVGWAWKRRDSLPFLTKPLYMVAMPFEYGSSRIMAGVHSGVDIINTALRNRVEWEALENKIANLQAELTQYKEVQAENKRLRQLLGFKSSHPQFDVMAAEVIGRDFGTWSNTLTINHGHNDGIEKYMPVISPQGVVGFISDVYPYSSRVQLMLDPRTSIGAVVQRLDSRVTSVVRGNGNSPMEPLFVNIAREADILDGDVLVTSGLGGIYPKGLLVGTIDSIHQDDNSFVKYAVVTPAADFSRLEEVMVLTNSREIAPDSPTVAPKLVPQTRRDEIEGVKGANTK